MATPRPLAAISLALACTACVYFLPHHGRFGDMVRGADDGDYEYDPLDTDPSDTENSVPDQEGMAPPVPKWHACRFSARKGGIYDLRPLSRNKKLVDAARTFMSPQTSITDADWIHQDDTKVNTTYFLNICSDVIMVPPACAALQKMDPAPAFQVTADGQCFFLGTLKTFQWRPIDTNTPGKGMELYYENGEACGLGVTRKIKFVFTCSKYFTIKDGPMVVYQAPSGCEYEVQWPSPVGCPNLPIMNKLGLQDVQGASTSTGKALVIIVVILGVVAVGAFFWKRRKNTEYTNL